MKKLMLVVLTMTICLTGFAQQGRGQRSLPEENDQRLEKLKEKLNLTEEQSVKIQSFLEQRSEALKDLKEKETAREEKMKKLQEIKETYEKKIKAELTEEQALKYDEMLKEARQKPTRHHRQK
ncbi:hypothetical protein [Marinilabilia salmonicolor]|uniref:hypothetical protein n=1 Tax=Marinilabilia salmonicolor TaxID=989 RepID=UPI00029A4145|nr:hypothetical protein [Marinilabilia salmonicolor]